MIRKIVLSAALVAATSLAGVEPAHAIVEGIGDSPRVSDLDRNLVANVALRAPTPTQNHAAQNFLADYPHAQIRFDNGSGSIDTLFNFASPPYAGSAEDAALAFVADHADLLGGLQAANLEIDSRLTRAVLGGHLLRFNQVVNGIVVDQAGLGIVVDGDNRVRALFGPVYPNVNTNLNPSLASEAAVALAIADLATSARNLNAQALNLLQPGFDAIEAQLGPLLTPHPELQIILSDGQPRLAWSFYQYSRNPFGLFLYKIDARNGQILQRLDQVRYQQEPIAQYADYFPTFPTITPALRDDCAILDANGEEVGTPLGQLRIQLRKFDQSNRVTGTQGVLTGDHAFIQNALATRAPFAQAAAGLYLFDQDEAPLYGRTEERDHLEEPSEHQDAISQFIYITGLIEYLDYLHKQGDAVHSGGFGGEGDFPDSYPNESTPLTGTVHIPNVIDPPEDTSDPEFVAKLMGLDNAFAVPVATTIGGQEVVVNPTAYGHGYLLNDLAIDFSVPIHEGTHATITPIAGFEGFPEGPALNEGQADLFAYSIGETPDLGTYPINACGLLDAVEAAGGDPESYQYIRSAQSQIRYSQLGTRNNEFEEHRDGEIYAGAMWDIRELMLELYPQGGFVRPDPITGEPTQPASLGKETWERIFLGSMYVLGLTSPDTMVRARDAMLIADSMLYPTDAVSGGPGRHFALIERVFAARELGIYADAPLGGRQTVSTAVSKWTADRASPATPQNIRVDILDAESMEISWDAVENAIAYQVLKRRSGDPRRLFEGVPGREYFDGDANFNGFTHVEYVLGETRYTDRGQGLGRGPGQGLDSLDFDYVIRAIALDGDGQVGFSNLSATAMPALKSKNVSDRVATRITDLSFSNGIFRFDQTLTNTGSETLFPPLAFRILGISEPSVSVVNADNGGSGQSRFDSAVFNYDQSLDPGVESDARELVFSNPQGKLFTFKARVSASVERGRKPAMGSQDPVDTPQRNEATRFYHYTETHTGVVPIGTTGLNLVDGADHVDIAFVAADGAFGVVSTLTASPEAGGAYPDLDYALLDSDGNELASSGNLGPNESLSAAIVPGESYTLRVIGFANGPTIYEVFVDQIVTDASDAGEGPGSELLDLPVEAVELEFLVDPLTGEVMQIGF